MQDMISAFGDDVTKALIPFIDSNFRTIPDREHRAMAGFRWAARRRLTHV
jgi:enterochelin esterase family protein